MDLVCEMVAAWTCTGGGAGTDRFSLIFMTTFALIEVVGDRGISSSVTMDVDGVVEHAVDSVDLLADMVL